jgi:stearoyl-CoA desaturase (delta-9 desaturase)
MLFASSTRGAQLSLIVALIGTVLSLGTFDASSLWLLMLGYFAYGCLGIVVTFHRKLTHQSYNTHPLLTKIFAVLGCFAGTGSPLAWIAIHLNHHRKSDKPNDPHSPMYKGWRIFTLDYVDEVDANTKWKMRRLVTDRFHQFLHRYYFLILFGWSALLFLLGGLYLMIWLHWAPMLVTAIMSNVVNYVGHKPTWFGGSRRYALNDQSSNNWLWAIPSWGESWHNNHHRHPRNYSLGEKWWEIDISAMVIRLIKT